MLLLALLVIKLFVRVKF